MSHLDTSDNTPRTILNWTGGIIGVSLIGMLGFALYALIYVPVPASNQNVLTVLIGILSTQVGAVVFFYFGASSTQKKQTDTIATLAQTAQTAGAALNPGGEATIDLKPGETAVAAVTEEGTTIQKDPAP